ncbi:hypothetical protein [Kytococcus sp. HMSC28H12]|uniref:hypothetical protein n=1 Tax=Kytococcus sp. HMSC28H12 TaxID=1581067 RepID=UPI0008A51839|nr:hypothetical protein [Kytococcus sp. HMSC28H12]OFS06174.1 hypothetical protein HMPREF3099_11420 [Kytococcus sp. HMSC28H12]
MTSARPATWGPVTFMMVVPYALGWATHTIPRRPVFDRAALEDQEAMDAFMEGYWRVRRANTGPGGINWDPVNHYRDTAGAPPGAPDVMMWDPTVLGAEPGSVEYQHWHEPHKYFHSARTRKAARPTRFACWPAEALNVYGRVFKGGPDLRLLAGERWEYSPSPDHDGHEMGYAVLHLELRHATDETLQATSELLRRPKPDGLLNMALHRMGLAVKVQKGAYSMVDAGYLKGSSAKDLEAVAGYPTTYDPRKRWLDGVGRPCTTTPRRVTVKVLDGETQLARTAREDASAAAASTPTVARTANRVRVLTVAAPLAPLTSRPSNLQALDAWTPEQAWTHQLATGMNRKRYFRLPPNNPEAAAHGSFAIDGSIGRATLDGVGVVIDPALQNPADEHDIASLTVLYHGRLLEVMLLAIRQRDWLDAHHESVAGLESDPDAPERGEENTETDEPSPEEGDLLSVVQASSAREKLREIMRTEARLNWFHNNRWFTEVPGRPEATTLLRELQEAFETPAMLADTRGELRDLIGSAELHKQLADLDQQDHADRARDRLEQLLALVTGVGLVLALAALVADPGWALAVSSTLAAVALGLAAWAWMRWRNVRRRRHLQQRHRTLE